MSWFSFLGPSISYVGNSNISPMLVADLIANYPPSASLLGQYARVSDLYGVVDDIMRCRFDGTNYRWVPQRPDFMVNNASTGSTVTLTPLVTAPTIRLVSNLLANMTVTPSTTNAYIGQRYRVIQVGTLGVFTSTITGLIGSNITLLGNTTKEVEYSAAGWFQSA